LASERLQGLPGLDNLFEMGVTNRPKENVNRRKTSGNRHLRLSVVRASPTSVGDVSDFGAFLPVSDVFLSEAAVTHRAKQGLRES
jgi:hypothetical protein